MVDYAKVAEILDGKFTGKAVDMRGWIQNKRSSGGIHFLIFRDEKGDTIQMTTRKDKDEKVFDEIGKLTQESSLYLKGKVNEDDRAPGGFEVSVESVKIIQVAEEWPLGKKEHGPDFLLSNRHLWLRSPMQIAIMRIRSTVINSAVDFLNNDDFVRIDAPVLTTNCGEDTTTLFETNYFGKKAYLGQTGQLYSEASIFSHGKVYCLGPSFRAEKSRTRRHINEYLHLEPEMAFFDFEDNIKLQEDLITAIVKGVLEKNTKDLELLGRDIDPLKKVKPPFPRLSYTDAIELLQKNDFEIEWGEDFGAPQEYFISEKYDKPLIVHRFPAAIKAFYMEPDPEDPKLALANDMVAPEGYGEIIGGSVRIFDPKLLDKKVKEIGIDPKAYDWYIDLRKFGSVPHAGFGMGIERVVWWLVKIDNIRETVPFPRTVNRIYP